MAVLAAVATLVVAACGANTSPRRDPAPRAVSKAASPRSPRRSDWLGINYNSSTPIGRIDEFSQYGIVWDRDGGLEIRAGATPASSPSLARGLRTSLAHGMIPDVLVDTAVGPSGCTTNPDTSGLCVPDTRAQGNAYAAGFARTVEAIRRLYPRRRIVYEPMNEPWDWGSPPGSPSGRLAAGEYAAVLARLLPALRAAGVPLSVIHVPATGTLADGSAWIGDLYSAQPCLAPGPRTCGPIAAWNVHVYGPPSSRTSGLPEVPALRTEMRSGAGKVIVSELGFCATDVERGSQCNQNTPTVDGTSAQTARWLAEDLRAARAMHAAGWLRALIIWTRSGGGWSMQLPGGGLTAQGQTLVRFAQAQRP